MNVNSVRLTNAYNVSINESQAKGNSPVPQQIGIINAKAVGNHDDLGTGNAILSKEEFQYFEQLYPNSSIDIQAYQTYRRDGSQTAFGTGTVIDRKG